MTETECQICLNENVNKLLRCQECNYKICNKCCLNMKGTDIEIQDNINISFKCPFCRYNTSLQNITDERLNLEVARKSLQKVSQLEKELETSNKKLLEYKNILESHLFIVKELTFVVRFQKSNNKKTFKVEHLESILNKKPTVIFQ